MTLRKMRFPAILVAFILLTMSACALLQCLAEQENTPSCHSSSEKSSDQKSDSSMKFCCETGLIPNPNKSPIFKEETNLTILKFQNIEESSLQVLSSFDVHTGIVSTGPPNASLTLPLRI